METSLRGYAVTDTAIANGNYVLGEALGHGGTAHVFRARRSSDSQWLAAKILPIHNIENPAALLARYQQIGRLEHPHILPIVDVGFEQETFYVISPIAEEGSLRQALQRGQIHRKLAIELIVQIADALEYAHRRGIVHLDVKPANILLARNRRPLLGDFGLIQPAPGPTGRARVRGTPAYMAPEQCTLRPTGPATDQYGLAITSFELLTGRRPFAADSPDEVLRRQVFDTPPVASAVCADLPRDLDHALSRALAKEPRERFPSVQAFAAALAKAMATATPGAPSHGQPLTGEDRTLDVLTLELRGGASGNRM